MASTRKRARSRSDYSPYEGIEITGWPTTVILAGRVVMADGALTGEARGGRYVARERPFGGPRMPGASGSGA